MRKGLKFFIVMLLVAAFTVSIVACGDSKAPGEQTSKNVAKDPVKIKYPTFLTGVNTGKEWHDKQLEEFKAKFGSEVIVEIEDIPDVSAYLDKIKVMLSANEAPDIVYGGGFNMIDIAPSAYQDITSYINEDAEWKATMDPRSIEFHTRGGKILGVGLQSQLMGYFYNKDLFAKAGITPAKTWDEFYANCDKLKAIGVAPLSMDTIDTAWISTLMLCSLIGTSGEEGNKFMNASLPKDYNKPYIIEAYKQLQRMFKDYTTKDVIGGSYQNGQNNFFGEKTAIMCNGPWMINDFTSKDAGAPEGFINKVGIAMYPENGLFNGPMQGYLCASRNKERTDASVKFIKFITSVESQSRALEMFTQTPASPLIKPSEEFKKTSPLMYELIGFVSQAKWQYNDYQALWYPNTYDFISANYPSFAAGKMTAEDLVAKMSETAAKN